MALGREQLSSHLPGLALTALGVTAVVIISYLFEAPLGWMIVLILLALLVWPLALVIDSRIKPPGSTAASANSAQIAPRKTKLSFPELEQSFAIAVSWLRANSAGQSRAESSRGTGMGWLRAKLTGDRDALYQRSWFVIAGPQGGGKTSLRISSGLNFYTLPGQIQAEQNLLHQTPACEWRISDDLVLLDTAGRYQDERFERDHGEWLGFINLLKRYRRRRPLDGLLLAINVAEVINADGQTIEQQRLNIEQQAKVLRDRLDELILKTGRRFPIYLIFTHADQIAGFSEFFRACDHEERAQVWGASFNTDGAGNQPDKLDLNKLDDEFKQLYEGLLRWRLVRLAMPVQPAEQARVFDFPSNFQGERRKFFWFISMLLQTRPHNEKRQPLLRGFYFTSSPSRDDGQSVGESYFTSDFFRTLLADDRHLAAWLQPAGLLNQYGRPVLLALGGLLLACLTGGLLVSFTQNSETIREGQRDAQAVIEAERAKDESKLWKELDHLREFLERQEAGPGLSQRFGLHLGDDLNQPLRAIYFEAISQRLFNPAVGEIEQDLRKLSTGQSNVCGQLSDEAARCYGRYYKLLRAYQMLSLTERVKPVVLTEAMERYWQKSAPEADAATRLNHLNFYAAQAARAYAPHWKADAEITKNAKAVLDSHYPQQNRYFDAITAKVDGQLASEQETFAGIFRSDWVASSLPVVPASFTLEGYKQLRPDLDRISPEIIRAEGLTEGIASRDVQNLYQAEYTSHWERFLAGITVRPFPKESQSLRKAFGELAKSESPLTRLLKKVAEQTGQIPPAPSGWWDKLFGSKPALPPGDVVEKFKPLAAFIANGEPQYLKALQSLQDKLDEIIVNGGPLTSESLRTALTQTESSVEKIIEPLDKGATHPAAELLRKPLSNLRRLIDGDAIDRLRTEWRSFGASVRAMSAHYPFNRGSRADASPDEVKRLFNPVNGVLANLGNELSKYLAFDSATRRWRYKEGQTFPAQSVIEYLNRVAQMQDAFFPNQSADLKVSYTLTVRTLPPGMSVEINGQRLATQQQSVQATWPPSGVTGIVVMQKDATIARQNDSGIWSIFRLVDQSGGRNFSLGPAQMTIQHTSKTDPFDRQVFSQLGNVPPMQ